MGRFSNFTYCIQCNKFELIEQALTRIFEQEGCPRIPLPPLSIDDIKERYYRQLRYELWMIGLFIGAPGWTIVKTFPQELLCHRARGADRPRLSELATRINSDAFYVGVYEYSGILMEANALGAIFISGDVDSGHSEADKFFDEQIDSQELGRFFLLNVPKEMQRAKQVLQEDESRRFEQWQEQFIENYAQEHFPEMAPSEREQWKVRWKTWVKEGCDDLLEEDGWWELHEAIGLDSSLLFSDGDHQLFDLALAELLGGPRSYWHLGAHPLVHRAYTQQQQLEADGARLLYFQPSEDYRQRNTRKI